MELKPVVRTNYSLSNVSIHLLDEIEEPFTVSFDKKEPVERSFCIGDEIEVISGPIGEVYSVDKFCQELCDRGFVVKGWHMDNNEYRVSYELYEFPCTNNVEQLMSIIEHYYLELSDVYSKFGIDSIHLKVSARPFNT